MRGRLKQWHHSHGAVAACIARTCSALPTHAVRLASPAHAVVRQTQQAAQPRLGARQCQRQLGRMRALARAHDAVCHAQPGYLRAVGVQGAQRGRVGIHQLPRVGVDHRQPVVHLVQHRVQQAQFQADG